MIKVIIPGLDYDNVFKDVIGSAKIISIEFLNSQPNLIERCPMPKALLRRWLKEHDLE